ncbi:MAG: hypothetical protein DGJ47_000769 [Rickettsiaceae bacterium]
MNKILCFDTSNNSCFVSVSCGQKILSYNENTTPSMQAETLLPLIERSLKEADYEYEDIDYLAVTTGPGSFTGIRVGLAVAESILHATNIQGVGISNFLASHYRLKQQVRSFDKAFVIINAYRNQQYVQEFDRKNPIGEAKLYSNEQILELLEKQTGTVVCNGSGVSALYEQMKHLNHLTILPRFPAIKAYHTARLADKLILKGKTPSIEPLYIRPPDAVIPS